jgi:hypothetical protein
LPAGEYDIDVSIVDEPTHTPKINIAIKGKMVDGWYNMGKITVIATSTNGGQ